MSKSTGLRACLLLFVAATAWRAAGSDSGRYWPQWRGPLMTGVAPNGDPPSEWSESKNVKWKVPIPGNGSATPVVWGEQIFVLTAVPSAKASGAQQFTALAVNRQDGKILWQ